MRFGPLAPVHINKLKEKLEKHGATYEIFVGPKGESITKIDDKDDIRIYPTFENHIDFLYIDIEAKYLLIVKEELLNLGFEYQLKSVPELPYKTEFICPKCKFHSFENGLCPKHKIPLLEWSDWLEYKRKKWQPYRRAVSLTVVIVMLGYIIYNLFYGSYSQSGGPP